MKIVIASDSFKGCLSSVEVGTAIREGIIKADPSAEPEVFPISDGGEGLSEALERSIGTKREIIEVTGPEFKSVKAAYGLNREKKTAVIEMAAAAGLPLVTGEKKVKEATTYGVGELILDAISKGARDFIIGIGGSATNDGGIGMLSALGFRFLDKNGNKVSPNANGLKDLVEIDISSAKAELKECRFIVACDVDIPLCGENGCSRIFAPQKGAGPEEIEEMDAWLSSYAELTGFVIDDSGKNIPGSGAAGGMGFALRSYLNAELKPGIDIVIANTGLETAIAQADLVITGEGRIDSQTSKGKVVSGIVRTAKKYDKPVIAFCGSAEPDVSIPGLERIIPVTPLDMPLSEAMKPETAKNNLERAAQHNLLTAT